MELSDTDLINYFTYLPDETILQTALDLPLNNILNFCLTNDRFNRIICNDNFFWKNKFIKDYGNIETENITNWKLLYLNTNNIWIFTDNEKLATYISSPHEGLVSHLTNTIAFDIGLSDNHSVVINNNNNIFVWGYNNFGQLGIGTTDSIDNQYKLNYIKAKKVSCSNSGTMLIDLDDNIWVAGIINRTPKRYIPNPMQLFTKINIKAKEISIGHDHCILIDLNNNIFVSGSNSNGQLGIPEYEETGELEFIHLQNFKAKKIACGKLCSAFVDFNDDVWVFGNNYYGQLGLGDYDNRRIPTKISELKAMEISMSTHTMVIDLEGKLWGFGVNKGGQFGNGNYVASSIPLLLHNNIRFKYINVSLGKTTVIDNDNNIWVCGGEIFDNYNRRSRNRQVDNILRIIYGYKAIKVVASNNKIMFIGNKI